MSCYCSETLRALQNSYFDGISSITCEWVGAVFPTAKIGKVFPNIEQEEASTSCEWETLVVASVSEDVVMEVFNVHGWLMNRR